MTFHDGLNGPHVLIELYSFQKGIDSIVHLVETYGFLTGVVKAVWLILVKLLPRELNIQGIFQLILQ